MAIRPVDMQIMIPKTSDYANKHQGELQKQVSDQQTFAQISAKQAEEKKSVVIETKQSKDTDQAVNKDGHNKQEYQGKKSKNKKQGESEEDNKKRNAGTGLFDMKI